MQHQTLTFPKASTVSTSDFFSGITPTPTPSILETLDKYKTDAPNEGEPFIDNPDSPPLDPSDTITPTQDIVNLVDKYKAAPAAPTADASKNEPTPTAPPAQTPAQAPVAPEIVQDAPAIEASESSSDSDIAGVPLHEVANFLQEKGLIVDLPEGFDPGNLTQDNFWDLVSFNVEKKAAEEFDTGYETARKDITNVVSEETLEILNYQLMNPNASEDEVRVHIQQVMYVRDIKDLDPSDPADAEIIIRQYLSSDHTPEQIEQELRDAKEMGRLEVRANMWKPILEQRANATLQQKRQRQLQTLQQDQQMHQAFMDKLDGVLKKNKIHGVDLSQEDLAKIRGIFANNRIPVQIGGGKTAELGLMDFLVRKNMYSPEGNVENLALAALILENGPKALEKYIANPVRKAETIKFASQKSSGIFSAAPNASKAQTSRAQDKSKLFWDQFKQAQ
jgi:hypothetical protein